jgi:hypothetical protein
MLRPAVLTLAATAFSAAAAAPAASDPLGFRFRVADAAAPDPVLHGDVTIAGGSYYGSLSARTEADPDRLASGRLRVGVRPRLGPNAFDLGYSQAGEACCGAFAAGVSRPLGRGRFGVNVSVDADTGTSSATTEASVPIGAHVTLNGRLDGRYAPAGDAETLKVEFAVVNAPSRRSRLEMRLREASDAPGRAEVLFRVTF